MRNHRTVSPIRRKAAFPPTFAINWDEEPLAPRLKSLIIRVVFPNERIRFEITLEEFENGAKSVYSVRN